VNTSLHSAPTSEIGVRQWSADLPAGVKDDVVAMGDHSHSMWVEPDVLKLFSGSVGSFLNNLGLSAIIFSLTVGTNMRCSRAGRFMLSRHYT
jgi:hypothetical protein